MTEVQLYLECKTARVVWHILQNIMGGGGLKKKMMTNYEILEFIAILHCLIEI